MGRIVQKIDQKFARTRPETGLDDIDAPIITDTKNVEQNARFESFLDRCQQSNLDSAVQEAERLSPYFEALSKNLRSALSAYQSKNSGKRDRLEDLTRPGGLSRLFLKTAAFTRNTIVSTTVIVPHTFFCHFKRSDGLIKSLYSPGGLPKKFYKESAHAGTPLSSGFLQFFETDDVVQNINVFGLAKWDITEKIEKSSTGFPILGLDDAILKRAGVMEGGIELLKSLQAVSSFANHDALHHFHSLVVNENVTHKFLDRKKTPLYREWEKKIKSGNDSDARGLESWSVLSHAKTTRTMRQGPEGEKLGKSVENYFDALERVAASLKQDESVSDYKVHSIVDYLNTVMAFTVMRIEEFHGPLMTRCLQRMERIDPDPSALLLDHLVHRIGKQGDRWLCKQNYPRTVTRLLENMPDDLDNSTYAELKKAIAPVMGRLFTNNLKPRTKGVLDAYRNAGTPITPEDNIFNNYADIKRVQLVKMAAPLADLFSPSDGRFEMEAAKANVGPLQLDMFETLSRTVNGP